jgi:hypothetical protein
MTMTTQAIKLGTLGVQAPDASALAGQLNPASSAFALSAAVTIVFSTLLTWAKEAYPGLHDFLAAMLGHHWTAHGVIDVAVFFALGLAFLRLGTAARMNARQLTVTLVAAVFGSGLGIASWFLTR